MKPKPGEMVVLIEIPRGMLDDLPPEDQAAITDVVGKPILFLEAQRCRIRLLLGAREGRRFYSDLLLTSPTFN